MSPRLIAVPALLLVVAATWLTFAPVIDHGLLNWDDPRVVTGNPSRELPVAALVRWAFTTTHMEHYQPLAWLAYAALPSPRAVHTAAVLLHALNGALLAWLIAWLTRTAGDEGPDWWLAAAAAALFAVHPMRVEPVAWASALPYLLSYAPLLVAAGAWFAWLRGAGARWYAASVAALAVSQLVRVTVPLAPAIGVALAALPGRAPVRPWATVLRAAAGLALVTVPLAWLEAGARNVETLADVGLAPRLAWALTHPAWYAWQTIAPGPRTALDVLPRVPVADWGPAAVGAIALAVAIAVTAQLASRRAAIAIWGTYLALLLPVSGLVASGVQLTADRYAYGPAMVLAAALAAAIARAPEGARRAALVVAGAAAVYFAQAARTEATYWRDSDTLWTRALALDPDNDVALFNLANAQAEAGRAEAAIETYARLVALVPDHAPARAARARLVADRDEARGDAAAHAGRLREAALAYGRALEAEATRPGLHAKRGMALAQAGDLAAALPHLEAAAAATTPDPAVVSALAFALLQAGRSADALAALARGHAAHPDDVALAANYARLLLTVEPPALRDPARGLALARQAAAATGARDPRLLDTLALGLAAAGRLAEARDTWTRAATLARAAGDGELAATLASRLAAARR